MNRIEIKDFSIKIDKDKVLKTLGCFEGSSVYETVSSYFDELEETVMNLLSPRAVAVTEDMKAYCILTVGEKISGISKSFFDNGEGMKGILVDAMADEYLFMMDDVLAEKYTTKYESVIAFGRVSLVSDSAEIRAAIEKFALKYCPKESEENRKKAIEDEWNALEMISFDIEHLTGKIGLEVLAERNENR